MSSLRVAVEKKDGVATLSLQGELDLSTANKLASYLAETSGKNLSATVLDLRELDFIDSSGLRTIVSADADARRAGRRFVLVEGPESVQRIFRHTLLDKRLEFVEDPEEIKL